MADIRVIILYKDEVESISVDGTDMEDISAIKGKPIADWFSASNGRDGWEGLIPEIREMINDKKAKLNFGFIGPEDSMHIFEQYILEKGYGDKVDGQPEIIREIMEKARKAEEEKLDERAFGHYRNAAKYGSWPEAQYKVAEYYYKCYRNEFDAGLDPQDAIKKVVEYYKEAASQGHIESQYRLYQLFRNGVGVKKSQEEAIFWLSKAGALQNECGRNQ